jgi:hypothetical protein
MIGAEDLVGEDFERRVANERKQSRKNSMFHHNSKNKMEAEEESDKKNTSKLIGNAFQIATDTNGYNSGRSYYLQTASASQKQEIIAHLKILATSARKKAEVKSLFRKTQDRVRALYISRPFQSGAALLIVAVQWSLPFRILLISYIKNFCSAPAQNSHTIHPNFTASSLMEALLALR